MPIPDINQTMRAPRYGAIATNPVPVNGSMPGQVPSGFPPNMQAVQQPSNVTLPQPPIVSAPVAAMPQQPVPQPNSGQAANQKMFKANRGVLDKNQMSGAINRRMKQNGVV